MIACSKKPFKHSTDLCNAPAGHVQPVTTTQDTPGAHYVCCDRLCEQDRWTNTGPTGWVVD